MGWAVCLGAASVTESLEPDLAELGGVKNDPCKLVPAVIDSKECGQEGERRLPKD